MLTPAESRCGDTSTAGLAATWPYHGGIGAIKNVADILWQVMANAVPGDFAELGVWRGGTCIFAKSILDVMGETRLVHVFDAFGTIPDYSGSAEFLAVRIETVMNGFHMYDAYGSNMSNVFFYKGLFKDTLPGSARVLCQAQGFQHEAGCSACGWQLHDSYQDALYYLYGFVPVGGFVILMMSFPQRGDASMERVQQGSWPSRRVDKNRYIYIYIYICIYIYI